jgi:hypothetical protein
MVKITLTMDTEREAITVSARMCFDAIAFIPQILDFIHQIEHEIEKQS